MSDFEKGIFEAFGGLFSGLMITAVISVFSVSGLILAEYYMVIHVLIALHGYIGMACWIFSTFKHGCLSFMIGWFVGTVCLLYFGFITLNSFVCDWFVFYLSVIIILVIAWYYDEI